MRGIISLSLVASLHLDGAVAQQVADTSFVPPIEQPAYEGGDGPIVMVDEAHHNFHTADGRYRVFAETLRRDGYRVIPSRSLFTPEALAGGDILVVSNAVHESNIDPADWKLPTPSAFSDAEIAAVHSWVEDGGALLLIADHMPMPGAAADLALAFGIRFNNGFAMDTLKSGAMTFRRSDGTLMSHVITNGRAPHEHVDSITTFTGQAFHTDSELQPLLRLGTSVVSLMPEVAWEFGPDTPRMGVAGWLQGAVRDYGKGSVAVFGEAAMFTAQRAGSNGRPMGMNAPGAEQNVQFLLNVMHWLSGILEHN
jgi:hypothetical protein